MTADSASGELMTCAAEQGRAPSASASVPGSEPTPTPTRLTQPKPRSNETEAPPDVDERRATGTLVDELTEPALAPSPAEIAVVGEPHDAELLREGAAGSGFAEGPTLGKRVGIVRRTRRRERVEVFEVGGACEEDAELGVGGGGAEGCSGHRGRGGKAAQSACAS